MSNPFISRWNSKVLTEIAQIERISRRDICAIIKEEARQQKHKHQQQQENTPAANNGE